jgi:dTDP-4-dehydrorhamnose 3,5-epimerase
MQIKPLAIPDVLLITLDRHDDARGYFIERYHSEKLAELGFRPKFVQDNHSRSHPGVLRGLHYQFNPEQGKLVGVIRGAIYDVAVDLRPDSPDFGKHIGVTISEDNPQLLWVPPGFAHGFCVLGDAVADVTYKVSGAYNKAGEGGIRFDDPDLAIQWPITDPILSERDRALQSLKEYTA